MLGAVEGAPPNVSAGFVPPNVNAGFVVGEADVADFVPPNKLSPVLDGLEGAPPNVNAGFVVGEMDVVRANKLLGAVEGAPPNVKAGFVVGEVDVAGVPPPNALPPVLDGLEGAPPNVKAGFVVGEVDAAGLRPRRFAFAGFFFRELNHTFIIFLSNSQK